MSDITENTELEPDPDDVAAFLATNSGQTIEQMQTPPTPNIPAAPAEITLSPEAMAAVRQAAAVEQATQEIEPKQMPNIPMPAHAQTEATSFNEFMSWIFESDKLGHVEASKEEQELYAKSFLTDSDLIFDVAVDYAGTHQLRIREMHVLDKDTVNAAMAIDQQERQVSDAFSGLTRVQQYAIVLQVISVDNIPADTFSQDTAPVELFARAKKLREHRARVLAKAKQGYLSLCIRAIMMFEMKLKLCNQHAVGGNFS